MALSSFVHIAANGSVSFFLMAKYYSIVYMHHIFFIHPSVNGRFGCFRILVIVNSAAVNTGVHVSFSIMFFWLYAWEWVKVSLNASVTGRPSVPIDR